MPSLNPPQQDAVNTLTGPTLVLAGAGTGKTRVITYRIARLIDKGIKPNRILGVTFTNKAAKEMQQRITDLLKHSRKVPRPKSRRKGKQKKADEDRPLISTFHSLCVRILRRHIETLGYPSRFVIYNSGDQEGLARTVLREINVSDNMLAPSQLLYWVGRWKNKSMTPAEAMLDCDSDQQHVAAIGYKRYQKQLKLSGAVDFDDLLLLTEQLFSEFDDVREEEAGRFDHLLIDEYQDTNSSQYRIVRALADGHRNLFVVGDDDQSIYGWRGAEVEHILGFKSDWPDAKVIRLEDNYRSTGSIIHFANTLIKFNKTRHDKVLRAARPGGPVPQILQFPNEQKEAAEIVHAIDRRLQEPGREPRDFAILFRTNEQPRPFETELRKARLPYILVGGLSFFDRKEVKDVMAYLRLLDGSPDEVSVLRILNTPPRGIGKKSAEALLDHSLKQKVALWDVVSGDAPGPVLPTNAMRGMKNLAVTIADVRDAGHSQSLVDTARNLIQAIGYRKEIDRLYSEPEDREVRWTGVEQIVNSLGEYEQSTRDPNLTEFLDKLLLGDQDTDNEKEKQLKKNAIMLMTLHSAKGLEFPEVYMVGLEEGILPHHRSLEDNEAGVAEERRLCYVGVTRAEEYLTLSLSLTRRKWGKARDTIPSRFLYELMDKVDHPNYKKRKGSKQR
ncbi:MAG: UvrD-helicase domain-containing protein [Planctomycetota bacterium]